MTSQLSVEFGLHKVLYFRILSTQTTNQQTDHLIINLSTHRPSLAWVTILITPTKTPLLIVQLPTPSLSPPPPPLPPLPSLPTCNQQPLILTPLTIPIPPNHSSPHPSTSLCCARISPRDPLPLLPTHHPLLSSVIQALVGVTSCNLTTSKSRGTDPNGKL